MLNFIASAGLHKPIILGDWNCVTRPEDVSKSVFGAPSDRDDETNKKSYFLQKKSKELKDLVTNFRYIDAFLSKNNVVDFTWLRKGCRASRLDRVYLPQGLAESLEEILQVLHLSDHKAVIVKMKGIFKLPKGKDEGETLSDFWKLNSQILEDKSFDVNFGIFLEEVLQSKSDTDPLEWYENIFKPSLKEFLVHFSTIRQQSRRDTRSLLLHYLQVAASHEDSELMSYLKDRVKKMNMEDSRGFVLRSRFKENIESERLSLFHMNREVKSGKKSSLNISKMVGEERVTINSKEESEKMIFSFFNSLFKGFHKRNGEIGETPFSPDFRDLNYFLSGVGTLGTLESEAMISDISLEEVED